ncbi:MAG: hypothetical protein IPF54_23935 [Draconibacterium sp.]|nr:hypothetical protein [Draconibacterium sp.]
MIITRGIPTIGIGNILGIVSIEYYGIYIGTEIENTTCSNIKRTSNSDNTASCLYFCIVTNSQIIKIGITGNCYCI